MARVGVFVCHCGENIGRTVDAAAVAAAAARLPGVVHAEDYRYTCSEPGQIRIREAVARDRLDAVVVAACSPRMHEKTFRRAVAAAGLNPYRCEMANIREHCSWIHEDRAAATAKAIDAVRMTVEKVKRNDRLEPIRIPVERRAVVIGGGVAGIQAALDIADAGHEVVLVEASPSIGGHMAQLSETFPTLDCSQCILTPRMVEAYQHPRITLLTFAEVEAVGGYIGNFTVTVRRKARGVREEACNGCGACAARCPAKKIPSEFEQGLGRRTAIYVPFPQAVPNVPVIDRENCLLFKARAQRAAKGNGDAAKGNGDAAKANGDAAKANGDAAKGNGDPKAPAKDACGLCAKACGRDAIDYDQQDERVEVRAGAIVVATGYRLYSIGREQDRPGLSGYGEYGYGTIPDVIDGLQFERLASASGPTGGKILRPSDGREPKTIAFLQCVGSRDPAKGLSYCSKICCMYVAKHAMLYRHKVHDGRAVVFAMDVRAAGKGYDEFVRRAVEQDGATYVRGRVARLYRDDGRIRVEAFDTIAGEPYALDADMVVLATAIRPSAGVAALAQKLSVSVDGDGFVNEAHPKLRPVETNTAGIFVAGACQAPRDIPDAVAMASAAAAKVAGLFAHDELEREPTVARVDPATCAGCFQCERVCPFGAIAHATAKGDRAVAEVNRGVCQGCGTCQATCPSKSIQLLGFTDEQIHAAIMAF